MKAGPLLTAPLIVVFLVGCGSQRTASANLTGKVTLGGQPVTGGVLYLHTADAGTYSANIDAEGNYRAVDIPPGEATVTIDNDYLDPNKKTPVYKGQGGGGGPPGSPGGGMAAKYSAAMGAKSGPPAGGGGPPKGKAVELGPIPEGAQVVKEGTYVQLPAIYKKKETSPVKIAVQSGTNHIDVDFPSK